MCRTLIFVAISAVLAQVACSQAIVPINSLLSNQVLLNSLAPNLVSLGPNVVNYDTVDTVISSPVLSSPCVQTPVIQAPVVPATTTIIQDNSVANSLANALQLLIVSNLLSNTLPTMGDVVIPAPVVDVASYAPVSFAGLDLVAPLSTCGPFNFAGLNGISYAVY